MMCFRVSSPVKQRGIATAMMRFNIKPPAKSAAQPIDGDDAFPKSTWLQDSQQTTSTAETMYGVPRGPATPSIRSGDESWEVSAQAKPHLAAHAALSLTLLGLEFSVAIADPAVPDCPLVACSLGFSRLTGYSPEESVGRNCRFLRQGVPAELLDGESCRRARAFCLAAADGYGEQDRGDSPEVLQRESACPRLGKGEELYLQTNARKSGECFLNMFFLKTVELDERPMIVGLQADVGAKYIGSGLESLKFCEDCFMTLAILNRNMDVVESALASQFSYSCGMRRS